MEIINNNIPTPKYYQLKQIFLNAMDGGQYSPGAKLPTIIELMKNYDVSITTASRVVKELINDGRIYAVRGKGCFVSGQNEPAANSKPSSSKKIALIFGASFGGTINQYVMKSLSNCLQARGYNLEIFWGDDNYDKETQLLSRFPNEQLGGLIFLPTFYESKYTQLIQLKNRRIPVILFERKIKGYDFDYVGTDNFGGTKRAVEYLIALGHRQIIFLGEKEFDSCLTERLEGYKEALRDRKIKIIPELIITDKSRISVSINREKYVYDNLKKLLLKKMKHTAIFAYNDDTALIAYRFFKEKNIKLPADISMISFGDYTDTLENLDVPITAVKQDVGNMGWSLGKLLLKRIDERLNGNRINSVKPEEILLQTKLIIRKSVRRVESEKV